MNKGLDLIQRRQIEVIDGYPTGNVYIGLTSEELEELKRELEDYQGLIKGLTLFDMSIVDNRQVKALEILTKKKVNIYWLFVCFEEGGLSRYNTYLYELYLNNRYLLTDEEYDLLKTQLLSD